MMNQERLNQMEEDAEFWQKMARISFLDAEWNRAIGNMARAVSLQEQARYDAAQAMALLDAAMIMRRGMRC